MQKLNNRDNYSNSFTNNTITNSVPLPVTLPTSQKNNGCVGEITQDSLQSKIEIEKIETPKDKTTEKQDHLLNLRLNKTDPQFYSQSNPQPRPDAQSAEFEGNVSNEVPHLVQHTYTPGAFALNSDRPSKGDNSTIMESYMNSTTTTKLDKLCDKFLKEQKESAAFKDTFFDKEIFIGVKCSRNYQYLSEQLLTYILHSSNKIPEESQDDSQTSQSSTTESGTAENSEPEAKEE